MTAEAEPVTHIDDGRFRVTEWRFAPGAQTGWHVHGHDYVIVPLADGVLGLDHPDGSRSEAPLRHGIPYSRRCGVEHNVTNAGPEPLAFLEVEVLGHELRAARERVLDRFAAAWNAHDLAALMDCMAEDCAFHAAGGPEAEGRRHQGRAAVEAAYAAIFAAYPDANWAPTRAPLLDGDTALTSWRFTGTAAGGARAEVDGCDILVFAGERIVLKDSYRKARS